MMVAPIVFLDPNMMAGILLYAFAGALIGGIDSPGGAVLGGFMVGVLENIVGAYLIGTELKLTVALVLIIGVLVVRPVGPVRQGPRDAGLSHGRRSRADRPPPSAPRTAARSRLRMADACAVLLALACALPFVRQQLPRRSSSRWCWSTRSRCSA